MVSINNTSLGMTTRCTFIISGTTVTFTNSSYIYTGTTSDTFIINHHGGSYNQRD